MITGSCPASRIGLHGHEAVDINYAKCIIIIIIIITLFAQRTQRNKQWIGQ